MPNLAQLTDAYYTDPVPAELPVEQPYLGVPADPDELRRVYINTPSREALPGEVATTGRPEPRPEPGIEENPLEVWAKKKAEGASLWDNLGMAGVEDKSGKSENKLLKKLFGLGGEERYQLWPEKVLREGLAGAGEVMDKGTNLGLRREDVTDIPPPQMPTIDSTRLGKLLGIAPVAASPQDDIIEKAQAISALAGSGGLAGTTDATLGSAPFLRPALKYKDRLYKGKEGQQHMDVIPKELYPEFEKMAMSGEDISHYNFGFVNDKGQFLTREKALEYGINTGLIDPHAGKFGALTSTLMADSSKPGTAIEAVAKTAPTLIVARKFSDGKIQSGRAGQIHSDLLDDAELIAGLDKVKGEMGFVSPDGKFLNRSDAIKYVNKYEPERGIDANSKGRGLEAVKYNENVLKADSSKEGAALQANKPNWKIKGFEDYNDWFHGTTHDFDKFSLAKGNPENYLGKNPHFTNSSKDVSANYAGMGPDLTQRIELKAEEIFQKIADKKYGGEVGDDYGKVMTAAKAKAKEELMGQHEGAVVPVNLKLENPISTVESRPTWLDFSAKVDKNGEFIAESPLAVKFYKSLQKQAQKYDFDPDNVMAGMVDNMYDEVKASDFDKALRNNEALTYAEDRKTGKLVSSDIIANIYKDMGFDGIVMDAKAAFPHMPNIPDGTLHAAPLKRNTVQSKITGQTLYNAAALPAGYQLVPVDYNPFESQKCPSLK